MIRIMLACAQGVSTSLLVSKMQKAAKERNIESKIWAGDYTSIEDELGQFDVVLLGPQVRYAFVEVKETVGDQGVVEVIKQQDYGKCDGDKVLTFALDLWEENRK